MQIGIFIFKQVFIRSGRTAQTAVVKRFLFLTGFYFLTGVLFFKQVLFSQVQVCLASAAQVAVIVNG